MTSPLLRNKPETARVLWERLLKRRTSCVHLHDTPLSSFECRSWRVSGSVPGVPALGVPVLRHHDGAARRRVRRLRELRARQDAPPHSS